MRRIIAIRGADRGAFLQALVTNDVTKSSPDKLIYSALLTPQGKYIADFFILSKENEILLDVAAPLADDLQQRLMMYRLRADVEIALSDVGVRTDLEGGFMDPRHSALPTRSYGPEGPCPDPCDLRVAHCIPESGIELTPDSYILECDFERLSGVDFKKGCYIGQEVTARMKHKAELRKGLVQLAIEGSAPIGTPITSDGRNCGTLYSQDNGLALAHIRFDRLTGTLNAGDAKLSQASL